MAKPPEFTGISADAVPDAPDWFKNLLPQMNGFFSDVKDALDKGVSTENLAEYTTTLALKTDSTGQPVGGLSFSKGVTGTPREVRVTQVTPTDTGGTTAGAVTCAHWTTDGKYVQVQQLTGLNAGANYSLTFAVR